MILQNVRVMYTLFYFLLLSNLYGHPGAAVYNPEIRSRGLHWLSGPAPQTVFDKTLCRHRFLFLLGKHPEVEELGVGWVYVQIHEKLLDLLPIHSLFFNHPPFLHRDRSIRSSCFLAVFFSLSSTSWRSSYSIYGMSSKFCPMGGSCWNLSRPLRMGI